MAFKMKKPLFNGTNQHKKELKSIPLKQTGEIKPPSGTPSPKTVAKTIKYTTKLATFNPYTASAANTILNNPVVKVANKGLGQTGAVVSMFVKHGMTQKKYKEQFPDSPYSWYTEDPRFQGAWQGGENLDMETGLPRMNLSEEHAISGGFFGYGETVFPGAKASYLEKLNNALKNESITKKQYDDAIKAYNL